MGTFFDNAHAAVPACNPSRAAVLTGQSPFHNGVEENGPDFYRDLDPTTTLPFLLHEAGYRTGGIGKVFHLMPLQERDRPSLDDFLATMYDRYRPTDGDRIEGHGKSILHALTPGTTPERSLADYRAVHWASDFVERQEGGKPWFISLGIGKPHLDWNVPQKYFDMIDDSAIVLPQNVSGDYDDVPAFYQQFLGWLHKMHDEVVGAGAWRSAIHAYMAAVAFADAQLGTFIDAMDRAQAWDNTTLVVWSDHGYHLGDKEVWGKFTQWEQATNAPLIIVDGDHGRQGRVVEKPVSLMDIFPTITELAGVQDSGHRDGQSLVPLMDDPDARWDGFAGSFIDGTISIRTPFYRYVLGVDGGEQLYQMNRDPGQVTNLADDPTRAHTLELLRERALAELGRLGAMLDLDAVALRGTSDRDVLWVSPNVHRARGGDGGDIYLAFAGRQIREKENGGFDTLRVVAHEEGQVVRLHVPDHVERVEAYQTAIFIDGTGQPDIIIGAAKNDTLRGRGGTDRLEGGAGHDRIHGGNGDDWIAGQSGHNIMAGGAGSDVFVFTGKAQDRILDFDVAEDSLDLSRLGLHGWEDVDISTGPHGDLLAEVPEVGLSILFDGVAPWRAHRLDVDF